MARNELLESCFLSIMSRHNDPVPQLSGPRCHCTDPSFRRKNYFQTLSIVTKYSYLKNAVIRFALPHCFGQPDPQGLTSLRGCGLDESAGFS